MHTPKFIAQEIANLERRYDACIPDSAVWDACRPQGGYLYTGSQKREARGYLQSIGSSEAFEVRRHWEALP